MQRYLNLSVARALFCILLFTSYTLANYWIDAIQTAKNKVTIMAPGLFSAKLIRHFETNPKIKYEIIINPESLHQPKLIIGNLPDNVSLRVLKTPYLIPHCIILIDSKKLLFGGSRLDDDKTLRFEPILIKDEDEVQKQRKKFKELWNSIDAVKNASRLSEHSNTLQNKTISVYSDQYEFVASRKSKVFHKYESPIAKRIKPHNRIYFNSWQEALESGRKPSKQINN